jgi:hypothetical protein
MATSRSDAGRAAADDRPTDEEVAAIVAAVETAWPRAAAVRPAAPPRWRFAGRWWSKPVPVRRERPW